MSDLKNVSFCPACGVQSFNQDSEKSYKCEKCDFTLYLNIGSAVGAIIECEEKILMIERAFAPEKGMLDLPGGFVDKHETAEEALAREIKEEVGLNLKVDCSQYFFSTINLYFYKGIEYHTLDFFYLIKLEEKTSISLNLGVETSRYFWLGINDIPLEKVAFESNQKALLKYREIN